MDLKRISNPNPVVREAVEEKQYPDWWPTRIEILSGRRGSISARVEVIPYDYDTEEFGPGDKGRTIRIDDLMAEAEQAEKEGDTILADAINNVLEAVGNYIHKNT